MKEKEAESFYPQNRQQWRDWLQENHAHKQSVWIIYYKIKSDMPSLSWSDAVDEALCFGWIDSTKKTLDHERFTQFFSKRNPKSVWSKINKDKVQRLLEAGLITPAGLKSIETAKQNGSWSMLDHVEDLHIPEDLEKAFKTKPGALDFFLSLSKSARKSILQWLAMAKRPETRQKRADEIVELAAQKLKPKQFR